MKRLYSRFLDLSLRTKLLVSFLLVMATLVTVTGATNYALSYNINRSLALRYTNAANAQMIMSLEQRTQDIEDTLFLQTQSPGLLRALGAAQGATEDFSNRQRLVAELESLLHASDYYDYVLLMDGGGRLYELTKRSKEDLPDLDLAALQQELYALRGSCSWTQDGDTIRVGRSIISAQNLQDLGTIVVGIPASAFEGFYSDVRDSSIDSTAFYNAQGEPIFAVEPGDPALQRLAYETYLQGGGTREPSFSTLDYGGESYLVTGMSSRRQDWKLVNVIDTRFIARDLRIILRTIFLLCGVLLLFAVLIAVLISRSMTENVDILMKNIDIIASGDWGVKVVPTSRDEIGRLALRFDFMRERIIALGEQVASEREDRKAQELRLLEARYAALRSQYNPHFLYNVLDSISSLALLRGEEEISSMIIMLTDMLRASVSRTAPAAPLRDEVEYVSKFTTLYEQIYQGNVGFTYDIPSGLMGMEAPSFVLQPLVENAVLHGIERKSGVGQVLIHAEERAGDLILTVVDNGAGFELPPDEALVPRPAGGGHHAHIGLYNVQERIRLRYGEGYGLFIESKPGAGTKVEVRLPLRPYAD